MDKIHQTVFKSFPYACKPRTNNDPQGGAQYISEALSATLFRRSVTFYWSLLICRGALLYVLDWKKVDRLSMEIFPGECPSLGKFSVCCELCTGEINWTSKNDKWILGFFCPPFGPYFQSHHIIIWSSWTGTWLIQCCVLEKPIETPVRAILGVRHNNISRFIVIWLFGLFLIS